MMWVPTSPRVSRAARSISEVEPPDGLGQPMADLLDPAGQHRVVEGEPDVVLDHPEPLAGPVGRGVEDPGEVDRLARLDQLERRDVAGQRDRGRLGGLATWPSTRAAPRPPARPGQPAAATGPSAASRPPAGARSRPTAVRSSALARVEASPSSGRRALRSTSAPEAPGPSSSRRPAVDAEPERFQEPSGASPNSARSAAARLSDSSARAAARSASSTEVADRALARASARRKARKAPAVNDSNIDASHCRGLSGLRTQD